jgi:hypothetical protein
LDFFQKYAFPMQFPSFATVAKMYFS